VSNDVAQPQPASVTPAAPVTSVMGVDTNSLASFSKLVRIDTQIEPTILGELKYTAAQVAERTGTTTAQVDEYMRWLGRSTPSDDAVRFADTDVEFINYVTAYAAAHQLSFAQMGSMIRGIAATIYRLAMRQTDAFIDHIAETENVGDTQARLRAAELVPSQAESMVPIFNHVWRRQLSNAVRRMTTSAIAQRGVYGDDQDYPLLRAIGFADLVNFTARTESASASEFYDLVREFTDRCWDIIVEHGGRVISFIGDAVLFTGDDINVGAEVALGLAAPGALGDCGQVRVGLVWTRVLATHGDVFGPGVNMAARIASAGIPGEVLVGPGVAAQLINVPRYQVIPQPPFEARGLGLVVPSRLRWADDPRNDDVETDTAASSDDAGLTASSVDTGT